MNTCYLLAIQQLTKVGFPKVGAKTVRQILAQLSVPVEQEQLEHEAVAEQILTAYEQVRRMPRNGQLVPLDRAGWERAVERADEVLDACAKHGVSAIGRDEVDYPSRLLTLEDAPTVLFIKGNPTALKPFRAAAFVGTREPSEYGSKAGYRLATLLTKAGLSIVSGLALGCDTIGHRACLDAGGQTVAVLAGGLDHIYPKENKALAAEILNKGGCLVAEHPVGIKPLSNYFVERDRLQSGLSDAVIVLETDIKGGTMHTVGFAEKQGRMLACFHHPSPYNDHPKAQGNQLLIREKRALPLGSQAEIEALLQRLGQLSEPASGSRPPAATSQPSLFK